ncbi:MAG: rhodanese-like domain-containing protein [Nakamurella sp.]
MLTRRGTERGQLAAALRDKGFADVVHVEGSFGAWQEAGLPTDPPAAP